MFIWTVATLEIYSCFFIPANLQSQSFNQLPIPNQQIYDVSVEEGFPAFYLYTPDNGGSFNNKTLFDYSFELKTFTGSTEVPAIDCSTFVTKYISSEYTRQ